MLASASLPNPNLDASEDGNVEPLGYADEDPLFNNIL
jgi:hypothetical protein